MANQAATFNVGTKARNYTTGNLLGTYSGVNLWLSDDAADQLTQQEVDELAPGGSFWVQKDEDGNPIILGYKSNPWSKTGRVLDIVNPFGTVAMASNILEALRQTNGIAINYSPFGADAIIPPHFEIGDAVSINGDHHGIYAFNTKASRLPLSNINAPTDEEIDHEYPFRSDVKTRQLTRKFGQVQSQFNVQADKISTKVEETGTNGSHTFGWSLTSRGFYINNGEVRADGTDLFSFTSSGLSIRGTIRADSGYIGGSNGFTIQSGKLYAGKSSLNSSANGVYIGTDGISLGSGFKVTSGGSLTATSGSFGSLSVSNGQSTYSGGLSGCGGSVSSGLSYSGGSYGSIGSLDTNLKNTVARVGTIEANYIKASAITAEFIRGKFGSSESFTCGSLRIGGRMVDTTSIDTSTGATWNNVLYLGGWY